MRRIPLWGGACSIDLPEGYENVENIRPVPDNQEVFVDMNSPRSLILEILEIPESSVSKSPKEIMQFHFDSIARANVASSSQLIDACEKPITSSFNARCYLAIGDQSIASPQPHALRLYLGLVRFENKNADFLVSWNNPEGEEAQLSSRDHTADDVLTLFEHIVTSFKLHDATLLS